MAHSHDGGVPRARSDMATAAQRLSEFALATRIDMLPPELVTKARGCVIDFLACALEAPDLPWGRQVIDYAAIGPKGPATVIGTGLTVAATEAAFANGTLGHSLIREDMHVASNIHLGVVVWPTLLALAQLGRMSGEDFLAGAVVGYEVGGRVGRALFDVNLASRLRPTGTVGAIAAAVAGARARGLGAEQTIAAIGLAANAAGGVNEWPWAGGSEVFFHAGFAARNAVTAVLLAERGVFASPTALDGRAGLFAAYGRRDKAAAIIPLEDGQYELMSVYWKPAPACNFVQTPCQAALSLVQRGVRASDIRRVQVASFHAALEYPGCNRSHNFAGVLEAKMSIQYSVAATLACGVIEEANYARLDDPEVLRLAAATELSVDPGLEAAYPGKQGVEIAVTLKDGSQRRVRLADVDSVDYAGVRARFEKVATRRLGRDMASALLAAADALPGVTDPAQLPAMTRCP